MMLIYSKYDICHVNSKICFNQREAEKYVINL